ncbi:chemokine (C-C motif) ligand 34b, duplicate 4 isoform X1 [Megalops cyprinoides]|uniref:chemokine (C-C motif) ligand 34b, duplicate 4 isoform X1 n=1 Tax=Megalops cyprinoides TaxID=118141 RepID=UPI0018642E9F|nr:chemokine (C-C motif) ligand 34b, duplicate 4 isoform X1 [Megalops cyprinoides]
MMSHCRKLFVVAAVLVVIGCVTSVSGSYRRPTKVTTQCCKSVSRSKIPHEIRAYKRQNALHPCVEAIVFYTNMGNICTNPKAKWIAEKIKGLKEIH